MADLEFLQSDVISNVVDALYTEQASVAGATWSPWINEKIDLSHISDISQAGHLQGALLLSHPYLLPLCP